MRNHLLRNCPVFLFLLLPLLLNACQPTSGQPAADGEPQAEATSPASATSTGGTGPVAVDLVLGTGPFFLPDPRVGLAELASYRETLTITFEGSESGQAKNWSSTYVMLYSSEPAVRLLTIEKSGDTPAADPAFLGEADGSAFEISAGGSCSVEVIDPEFSPIELFEPASLLSGLLGADEAGQETMNGAAADHYTFDERAIVLSGRAESSGEVWVAADGGYILKYLLTTTGDAAYFGEGIEGTLTWDYALTDINVPLDMELPAACLEVLVSAPRLADASNVLNLAGWLAYDTSSSAAEAAAFYQEQLPLLGWTPPLESIIADTDAYLVFTKGDQTLEVIITMGDAGTKVNILLSSAEE